MLNPKLSGKPFLNEGLKEFSGEPPVIGWIRQRQIKLVLAQPPHKSHGLAPHHPAFLFSAQVFDVRPQGTDGSSGPFHENHLAGPPAQGFQA